MNWNISNEHIFPQTIDYEKQYSYSQLYNIVTRSVLNAINFWSLSTLCCLQNSGITIRFFTNLTRQTSSLLPIGRFNMWPLPCTQRLPQRCSLTQSDERQKVVGERRGGTEVKLNVDSTHMWQDRAVLLMREKYSLKNKTLVWFSLSPAGQSITQSPDETGALLLNLQMFIRQTVDTRRGIIKRMKSGNQWPQLVCGQFCLGLWFLCVMCNYRQQVNYEQTCSGVTQSSCTTVQLQHYGSN